MDQTAHPFTVLLLIPTGIGAAIGGYAGDGLPVARAMAQVAECLITHPNVLNGAQLYWPLANALYVEGYGLDQFAAGQWSLRPRRHNRLGLLLDQGIETELMWRQLQAASACQATLGLTISAHEVTDAPVEVQLQMATSGATWGRVVNPDTLLRGAEKLLRRGDVDALAVVTRFPDLSCGAALTAYRHGHGVDPVAGAEAVISHLIVREFQIPCAHAPALSPLPLDPQISARAAAEELGYTFLPSVLVGLSRAPQFVSGPPQSGDITAAHVDAVVVPAGACGGPAVIHLSQSTPILSVRDNVTRMEASAPALGIPTLEVGSYLEALGVLAAWRAGVNPLTLGSGVPSLGR